MLRTGHGPSSPQLPFFSRGPPGAGPAAPNPLLTTKPGDVKDTLPPGTFPSAPPPLANLTGLPRHRWWRGLGRCWGWGEGPSPPGFWPLAPHLLHPMGFLGLFRGYLAGQISWPDRVMLGHRTSISCAHTLAPSSPGAPGTLPFSQTVPEALILRTVGEHMFPMTCHQFLTPLGAAGKPPEARV